MNPKEQLIQEIEKQVNLFQTTAGKANTNVIATVSTILNSMGNTILVQFDEIEKLRAELKSKDAKKDK
jgi:hypothetical protein